SCPPSSKTVFGGRTFLSAIFKNSFSEGGHSCPPSSTPSRQQLHQKHIAVPPIVLRAAIKLPTRWIEVDETGECTNHIYSSECIDSDVVRERGAVLAAETTHLQEISIRIQLFYIGIRSLKLPRQRGRVPRL